MIDKKKYPVLAEILTLTKADPALKYAEVEVGMGVGINPNSGKLLSQPDEEDVKVSYAGLLLPEVTEDDYKQLPKNFAFKIPYVYESEQGMILDFEFDFDVTITGAKKQTNGLMELEYDAKFVDWEFA